MNKQGGIVKPRPCPLCGTQVWVVEMRVCFVRCGNDLCQMRGPIAHKPDDAIAKWNLLQADPLMAGKV